VTFNGRNGAVTLGSSDVTTALGYTPPTPSGIGATGTWSINISGSSGSTAYATSAGSAATATTASSPASGGSFVTSTNIGSQSVNFATTAGTATTATNATNATYATYANGGYTLITSNNIASQSVSSANTATTATTATTANGLNASNSYTVNELTTTSYMLPQGYRLISFDGQLTLWNSANTNGVRIVNNTYSGAVWSCDDSGKTTASGSVTAYSDARLKTDVTTIANALDIVSSLRGTAFVKDGKAGIGVIAQEVQKVLPQVVHENSDGYLSVAYGNIVGVLIEAVKELKAEIETLKNRN
jgi:hypothetical protein